MKLYLGNLPYEASESELREFLSPYEPLVDFHLPLDRDTGRPRGFAFVTLSSREIGEKAIEELDGADFNGRPARVREAEDRPRGGVPPLHFALGKQDEIEGGEQRTERAVQEFAAQGGRPESLRSSEYPVMREQDPDDDEDMTIVPGTGPAGPAERHA